MTEAWDTFFVAETAAAAALLGLLFVAISINLKQVLEAGGLPERAAGALILLLAILLIGLLLAMPGQSLFFAAAETVAVSVVTGIIAVWLGVRGLGASEQQYRGNFAWNIIGSAGALLPIAIGGLLLFAGNESGLYWVGIGMCLTITKAVSEGWIFLIEINR